MNIEIKGRHIPEETKEGIKEVIKKYIFGDDIKGTLEERLNNLFNINIKRGNGQKSYENMAIAYIEGHYGYFIDLLKEKEREEKYNEKGRETLEEINQKIEQMEKDLKELRRMRKKLENKNKIKPS